MFMPIIRYKRIGIKYFTKNILFNVELIFSLLQEFDYRILDRFSFMFGWISNVCGGIHSPS